MFFGSGGDQIRSDGSFRLARAGPGPLPVDGLCGTTPAVVASGSARQ